MQPVTIAGGTELFDNATPHIVQTLFRIWSYGYQLVTMPSSLPSR
jgi:hypothetical protein